MVSVITRTAWAPLMAVIVTGILTGCGSGGRASNVLARRQPRSSTEHAPAQPAPPIPDTIPAPGPTGIPATPAAVDVIRGWSDALRRGDVRGAAGYFALPSVMINGPDANGEAVITPIDTLAQAVLANSSLPCGAKFISADRRGRYVNALFRLTNRAGPGGQVGCGSGVGETARTNFVIRSGHILQWIRAPDDPQDNGGGGGTVPAPAPPTTPTTPAAPSSQPTV